MKNAEDVTFGSSGLNRAAASRGTEKARASKGDSFISILPPGNSHHPLHARPGGLWAIRRNPSCLWITAAAARTIFTI